MSKTKQKGVMETLLSGILDRVEKMEKFTLEQAPELCKEIVAVEVRKNANSAIIDSLTFAGLSSLSVVLAKYATMTIEETHRTTMGQDICGFGAICAGVISLIALYSAMDSLLYISVIKAGPKLVVLEKLSKLLRNR